LCWWRCADWQLWLQYFTSFRACFQFIIAGWHVATVGAF
jgi:hypothetical protein